MTSSSRKEHGCEHFQRIFKTIIVVLSVAQAISPSFADDAKLQLVPQTPQVTPPDAANAQTAPAVPTASTPPVTPALTSPATAAAAPKTAKGNTKTSPLTGKSAWFSRGRVIAASASQQKRELLKAQAESQLRQSAQEAINVLQKMQKDGRPTSEITAEETRRKTQVENQQKALAELVGKSMSEGRAELAEAVAAVAREKGLTLVLDLDGIFYGGEDLKETSRDVTDAVISRMR